MTREATTPPPSGRSSAIRVRRVYRFFRDVFELSVRAQIDAQAAQIAFNAVFSLGPVLTLTTMLLAAARGPELGHKVREVLFPYVPMAVWPLLDALLNAPPRPPQIWLVALSFLALLWTLSSATVSMSMALGTVGWRVVEGFVRRRLRALVIGSAVVLGLALSAIAAGVGPWVLRVLSHLLRVPLPDLTAVAWVRWPISATAYGLACAMFVRFGTAERPSWRAVLLGGTFTGATSTGATALLAVYFAHSYTSGEAYGTAGAVFAALLWLYALSLAFMIGAVCAFVVEDERGAPHASLPDLPSPAGASSRGGRGGG